MSLVSQEIRGYMQNSSWIRKMFEAGIELKKQYGEEAVSDFSLGNPDLPPPPAVKAALTEIAEKADQPFSLGYMPNAGYSDVRAIVAKKAGEEQKVALSGGDVVMTCGAAGGINALFRAILSPGSEVICPSPYFVEYGFYVSNFGGKLVTVPSRDFTFDLDPEALTAAITKNTRAVLINSPNNPTGQIYSREQIQTLAEGIQAAEKKFGTDICLISDEPYRFLNYDNAEIPSVLRYHPNSVVIGSYSKTISLAGERLGYIAVNPAMKDHNTFVSAITMTNRILGFVNAPCLAQQIIRKSIDAAVDLNIYRERRDAMAKLLTEAGIEYTMPRGAFYFFPRTPLKDDTEFVNILMNEKVLAVPGSGFGCPGYMRLAFCVGTQIIERAAEGLKAAVRKCR